MANLDFAAETLFHLLEEQALQMGGIIKELEGEQDCNDQ